MMKNVHTFSALAEPNRLRIVELLLNGPLTVGEIGEKLGLRQPQVSKHLKQLLESGLVEVKPDANRRHYSLRPEPFRALDTWLEHYRSVWEDRFDNLDSYLKQLQADIDKQDDKDH
jgi:DNA-binding transcriptional ArsR family regulator